MSIRHVIADFEKLSVLLFASITMGTTGATWAQNAVDTAPAAAVPAQSALFALIDVDRSLTVSQDEAQTVPGLNEQFSVMDNDGDGVISLAEWTAAMAPQERQVSEASPR